LQPAAWQHLLSGNIGSRHITQGLVLLGAIILETALPMALLSRILPSRPPWGRVTFWTTLPSAM
jgi:hypothetical protein